MRDPFAANLDEAGYLAVYETHPQIYSYGKSIIKKNLNKVLK